MWSLMVAMASIVMSRLDVSQDRDVSTGATGVAPKFSDTLTLFQPGGADSAHHCTVVGYTQCARRKLNSKS